MEEGNRLVLHQSFGHKHSRLLLVHNGILLRVENARPLLTPVGAVLHVEITHGCPQLLVCLPHDEARGELLRHASQDASRIVRQHDAHRTDLEVDNGLNVGGAASLPWRHLIGRDIEFRKELVTLVVVPLQAHFLLVIARILLAEPARQHRLLLLLLLLLGTELFLQLLLLLHLVCCNLAEEKDILNAQTVLQLLKSSQSLRVVRKRRLRAQLPLVQINVLCALLLEMHVVLPSGVAMLLLVVALDALNRKAPPAVRILLGVLRGTISLVLCTQRLCVQSAHELEHVSILLLVQLHHELVQFAVHHRNGLRPVGPVPADRTELARHLQTLSRVLVHVLGIQILLQQCPLLLHRSSPHTILPNVSVSVHDALKLIDLIGPAQLCRHFLHHLVYGSLAQLHRTCVQLRVQMERDGLQNEVLRREAGELGTHLLRLLERHQHALLQLLR